MSDKYEKTEKELSDNNGFTVGDFVTTEWKGYFNIVKIVEVKTLNKHTNGVSRSVRYYVQYVSSSMGIISKSNTKIRETMGWEMEKVTAKSLEDGRKRDIKKWDSLSNFMFPKEEEESMKDEIANPYFESLGSNLLREEG
jgi:hypothetical protein